MKKSHISLPYEMWKPRGSFNDMVSVALRYFPVRLIYEEPTCSVGWKAHTRAFGPHSWAVLRFR